MSRLVIASIVVGATFAYSCLEAEHQASVSTPPDVSVEISLGDLVDKIVILEIKNSRFTDPVKLKNVNTELAALRAVFDERVVCPAEFDQLYERLLTANQHLWELEDLTRIKGRAKQFDDQFAEYVKDIINTNDERARIKHELNMLLGSGIVEEKSYVDLLYSPSKSKQQDSILLAVPAPLADVADRITILQIKAERIKDPEKLEHIKQELSLLQNKFYSVVPHSAEIVQLMKELHEANEHEWDLHDGLRAKRRASQFDEEFIQLGRGVYQASAKRGALKSRINQLLGSRLVEEKCYAAY